VKPRLPEGPTIYAAIKVTEECTRAVSPQDPDLAEPGVRGHEIERLVPVHVDPCDLRPERR
jgi:hypothetical protein